MDTACLLTVPDPGHKLTQLGPNDPEANAVPDAGEVVDIQRFTAIRLVVGWPPVVLTLHPGVDAHIESLVQPRAPRASYCNLVTAVLSLALWGCACSLLSARALVTFSSGYRACEHITTPGLHTRPAGLRAWAPWAPASPLTGLGTRCGLTWSALWRSSASGSTCHASLTCLSAHPASCWAPAPPSVAPILTALLALGLPLGGVALNHGALHPLPLPGLFGVQGAAVPVVAGLEVVCLPYGPSQAPCVPEEDPVLVSVDIHRPVRGPAHAQGVGVEVVSVTVSKVRITHFKQRTFGHSPA